MKRNFNLIFFLKKGKTDPQGASSIYMRITIDKKRAEMATGKSCLDNEWDNGQLKGSTSLVKTINLYLRQIESKVHDAHRHLLMCNDDITAKNLMNEFLGKDRKARKLTEVFEEHNRQMAELIGIEFAPMTLLRYQTALRHLR